jgi:RNA methyltransferase, TrmH family
MAASDGSSKQHRDLSSVPFSQERISSPANPRIRQWARLGERRERMEAGCFLVEGIRLVTEAVASGAPVRVLLADESGWPHLASLLSRNPDLQVLSVTSEVLAKLSDTRSPQGLAAIVSLPGQAFASHQANAPFGPVLPGKKPLTRILLLEQVQDPGNVGTMLRSADACGFDAVIVSVDSADPWQPKVVRASMGSLWHIPVYLTGQPVESVRAAAAAGLVTYAADPHQAEPAWHQDLRDRFLLVVGNEANGLSKSMREAVTRTLMIPMQGRAESLNAAAAASMLMYESLRQRMGQAMDRE